MRPNYVSLIQTIHVSAGLKEIHQITT